MKLSEDALWEFVAAYEADFGETISLAQAREMASRLLSVIKLLATDPTPAPEEKPV